MDANTHLVHLKAEGTTLLDTARLGLELAVPTCPGWTVRDVVMHVGQVYRHKVECMRRQAAPDPWPPQWQVDDPVAWLSESLDELVDELTRRGPDAPSYTWYPPDQTVGFWYRRMAQETAVHRVDVQSATGDVTPVDDDLAVDGVDELLVVFFSGDWTDYEGPGEPPGAGRVAVRTGDRAWLVTLTPDRVDVSSEPGPADATVTGEPSEVLLWLWGRRPDSAVRVEGDVEVLAGMKARLQHVMQ